MVVDYSGTFRSRGSVRAGRASEGEDNNNQYMETPDSTARTRGVRRNQRLAPHPTHDLTPLSPPALGISHANPGNRISFLKVEIEPYIIGLRLEAYQLSSHDRHHDHVQA